MSERKSKLRNGGDKKTVMAAPAHRPTTSAVAATAGNCITTFTAGDSGSSSHAWISDVEVRWYHSESYFLTIHHCATKTVVSLQLLF